MTEYSSLKSAHTSRASRYANQTATKMHHTDLTATQRATIKPHDLTATRHTAIKPAQHTSAAIQLALR